MRSPHVFLFFLVTLTVFQPTPSFALSNGQCNVIETLATASWSDMESLNHFSPEEKQSRHANVEALGEIITEFYQGFTPADSDLLQFLVEKRDGELQEQARRTFFAKFDVNLKAMREKHEWVTCPANTRWTRKMNRISGTNPALNACRTLGWV